MPQVEHIVAMFNKWPWSALFVPSASLGLHLSVSLSSDSPHPFFPDSLSSCPNFWVSVVFLSLSRSLSFSPHDFSVSPNLNFDQASGK